MKLSLTVVVSINSTTADLLANDAPADECAVKKKKKKSNIKKKKTTDNVSMISIKETEKKNLKNLYLPDAVLLKHLLAALQAKDMWTSWTN